MYFLTVALHINTWSIQREDLTLKRRRLCNDKNQKKIFKIWWSVLSLSWKGWKEGISIFFLQFFWHLAMSFNFCVSMNFLMTSIYKHMRKTTGLPLTISTYLPSLINSRMFECMRMLLDLKGKKDVSWYAKLVLGSLKPT